MRLPRSRLLEASRNRCGLGAILQSDIRRILILGKFIRASTMTAFKDLQDRYGATATVADAKRLAQAVKTIFEKVEMEFCSHAGYVPAHTMINAIGGHLERAEKLLGQARFASILVDTMPQTWSPMLKASFIYVLASRLKDVVDV